MVSSRSVEVSDEARDEFLGNGGTGVISFNAAESDDAPYARPVSYGYDPSDTTFFFRLAFGPESEKREVVGASAPVTFVVHDRGDEGWQSVVASGRLERVTEAAIDSDVVQAIRRVHIPLVDVFERHPRELEFEFYRLVADSVSARKEAQAES
ncbi:MULTISPECIES: pyridoxamine 5'-phosphate oxidase family protein [Haloprofundus]|uniref:pyridoxamine 5'-phosphate oxidase family protein n=1 Tax=Haloprofundus TaxID=1911573 RepID=UPI000E44449B|nr:MULTISPECIES: pyridoxamine 5'-phosphate oxidase family protein [Haloprofundus]QCJ46375.1 pyridoxamine 5'-phosphate oxidase family protein [Haloprofundus sp. MHR1]